MVHRRRRCSRIHIGEMHIHIGEMYIPAGGFGESQLEFHREKNFNDYYRWILVIISYICLVIKTNQS